MNINAVFNQDLSETFEPLKFNRRLFEQFPPGVRTFFLVSSNICNRNCSNAGRKLFERTKVKKHNKCNKLILSELQIANFGRIFDKRCVW